MINRKEHENTALVHLGGLLLFEEPRKPPSGGASPAPILTSAAAQLKEPETIGLTDQQIDITEIESMEHQEF